MDLTPSILYALSAPSMPDEVRTENIVEHEFFAENVDWARFMENKNRTNGLPIKDFIVTIDFLSV